MQSTFSNRSHQKKNEFPFLEIHTIEQLNRSQLDQLATTHAQENFEITWLQEGSGIQVINKEQYPLGNNSLHWVLPEQQHHLHIEDGSKGFIISFNEAFLSGCYEDFNGMQEISFFRMFSQRPALSIEADLSADMQELAMKLLKEQANQFLLKNEVLSKYLKIFLIYVKRISQATETFVQSNSNLFNNFVWLLENNFKEKKAVADYAHELAVTPSYLNHVIKKTSGYPASHHIQQRIVLEAKRKVRFTGASMKEVAYYLGFDDIAHFSKFFKTSSGMNFTTFRNSSLGARA